MEPVLDMHPKMVSHWSLNIDVNEVAVFEEGEKHALYDERDRNEMFPFNIWYGHFN